MLEEKEDKNNNEELLNDILKTDHRKVVEDIFHSDKEKIVSLKKPSLLKRIIVLLVAFLLLAIGVMCVVFLKFNSTIDTKIVPADYSNKIILNIDSPLGVNNDGQIEYSLLFKNTEQYAMKDIELSVRFPTEFTYISSDTETSLINDEYIKWKFDTVNPGEEKKVTIKGTLFGAVGVESVLIASMNYKFDSISSTFSSNSSYKTVINKSIFDIVVDRNDVFYKDKEITYKIKIKNNSQKALKNIKLAFKYPEYFKINKYSEDPAKIYKNEQVYWIFDLNKKQDDKTDATLDDYYEKIITVTGVVDSDNISEINFNISAGIVVDMGNVDDSDYTVSKDDSIRTSMSGLNFVVNTASEIYDNNGRIAVANVDNPYKISFKYSKTNADLSFKDLRLVVEFLGDDIINPKINFSSVPKFTNTSSGDLSNYVIEWDKTNNSGFKDVSSTEKELSMTLSFKKDILTKYKDGGYYSNVKITLFGKNNSDKEITLVDNKTFKLVLDSDLNVKTSSVKVNLKNGVKSNPLEVSVSLLNYYNNLTGAAVYFTLPDGVEYSSDSILSKSAKFDYDVSTKKISWVIGDIGAFENEIIGKFYLDVTPNSKLVGKTMELTSKINVVYKDTTINKDFSVDINPIVSVGKVSK